MEETWEIGTGISWRLSTSKDSKEGEKKDSKEEIEADFDAGPEEEGRKVDKVLIGATEDSFSKWSDGKELNGEEDILG